ncbi:PEP-CTERM sorting domain-containing protein [Paucibacter sp. hw8]|uniref:PEP-CTERM sorting domain-containing protein n=2 Tax=Roseateles albus TaxID=2987525 RepID=A0ABT5K9I9_9BURK|nr:PEP-CTERM sorting domain-containing protein [Roseateles albus]
MFYNATLDLTILNDWNIGRGNWSATAAAGSAQALAETAGASQTNFKGWFLPTGDFDLAAGSGNQFKAIWDAAGGSFTSLAAQFDRVQYWDYWSSTEFAPYPYHALGFFTGDGSQSRADKNYELNALAVRSGDVAAAVPEPETYAMLLAGLGLMGLVARRRSKQQ